MLFVLLSANKYYCFSRATLSSQVTSRIVSLILEPNGEANCEAYYNTNNSASLVFSTQDLGKTVSNFSYSGEQLILDFDYSTLSDANFNLLLQETLIVYNIYLVNLIQEGSIPVIEHTYINATNCWDNVVAEYAFKEYIKITLNPLKCYLTAAPKTILFYWRISQDWESYTIYDNVVFDYENTKTFIIDKSMANYDDAKFNKFFDDLTKNITLEGRIALSYKEEDLQMLVISALNNVQTGSCLEDLNVYSYLSRFYVYFYFDVEKINLCHLVDPQNVRLQAAALGTFLDINVTYAAFINYKSIIIDLPDYLYIIKDNEYLSCTFVLSFFDTNEKITQFFSRQKLYLSCLEKMELVVGQSSIRIDLFRIYIKRCIDIGLSLYYTELELFASDGANYQSYAYFKFKAAISQDFVEATLDQYTDTLPGSLKTRLVKLKNRAKKGDQVHYVLSNEIERQVGYNLEFELTQNTIVGLGVIFGLVAISVVVIVIILSKVMRI